MKQVPLSKGYVALVDDEDFELVSAHRWCVVMPGKNVYAVRKVRRGDGSWTNQSLHRFLLDAGPGERVGHLDGDGLNCARTNLRRVSRSESSYNACRTRGHGRQSNNKSGFIGVSWDARLGKWRAQIQVAGQKKHLGHHPTAEDAARARDRAAIELHGELAVLNFPGGLS
ncbi:AP2 domain-containing protein [Lentzea sp. E54]|uniref:AP2 domain-containing protein n=1 Tax=Lentzea xerophila TaxID=3435883 RepID=UPI003DA625D4